MDMKLEVEVVRSELGACGVGVLRVFHDSQAAFHHAGTESLVTGPNQQVRSNFSFASFSDSEGNGRLLQEVETRVFGR